MILYNHLFAKGSIPERRANAVADIYTDTQWTTVYAIIKDNIASRKDYALKEAFKSESVLLGFITLLKTAGVGSSTITDFVTAIGKPDSDVSDYIRTSMNPYYADKVGINATNYYKQFVAAWNAFITGRCSVVVDALETLDPSQYMIIPALPEKEAG